MLCKPKPRYYVSHQKGSNNMISHFIQSVEIHFWNAYTQVKYVRYARKNIRIQNTLHFDTYLKRMPTLTAEVFVEAAAVAVVFFPNFMPFFNALMDNDFTDLAALVVFDGSPLILLALLISMSWSDTEAAMFRWCLSWPGASSLDSFLTPIILWMKCPLEGSVGVKELELDFLEKSVWLQKRPVQFIQVGIPMRTIFAASLVNTERVAFKSQK